ncbi:MAG TPA: hypothetical protein VGB26_00060 [Nitrospiria bacterium]
MKINGKKNLFIIPGLMAFALGFFLLSAETAKAGDFDFTCIPPPLLQQNCDDGEAQTSFDITEPTPGTVRFTFTNVGGIPMKIATVYFDDMNGDLQGPMTFIEAGSGIVDFEEEFGPKDPPRGANLIPPFVSEFSAEKVDGDVDAVDPGESLGVEFTIAGGKTFADILDDLGSGALRIAEHVINFASTNGSSEAFVNNAKYGLTVTLAGSGTGTVNSAPSGINCPGDCSEFYNTGTIVTLTPTPDGGSVFAGWTGDPDCSDGQVTMNGTISCTATFTSVSSDLSITKTDSSDPVVVGGNVTYSVTVTNNGPDNATGVVVTDTLDPSVTYVSATPSQGTCSEAGGTVTCNLGSIANGANATISIVVTTTMTGTIGNAASVSGNETDPDESNNTTPVVQTTVVSQSVDLSITKTDNPYDPVDVGLDITYTVTVTNNGPGGATGVTVTDTLDPNVNYVSATPSQGSCVEGGGVVTCSLGALANGANATITIVVSTTVAGIVGNTADVAGNESDSDLSNNSATENTNVGDVSRLINISTRAEVRTGDNVMIGGFILGGGVPKTILVRAQGPSLVDFGVSGVMANPTLELYSDSTLIAQNDDWQDPVTQCDSPATGCGDAAAIQATGLDPCTAATTGCTFDSAVLITLPPGPYTAIMRGVGGGTGVGLLGVFDPDTGTLPKLVNISTRGLVLTGDSVMIGGFIIGAGTGNKSVLVRAQGPSLVDFGVSGVLPNPTMQLYSGSTVIARNNDWQTTDPLCGSPATACGDDQDIIATGLDPCTAATTGCTLDSAIHITLPPGPYTAIVSGVGGATGVGLVGIFELGP